MNETERTYPKTDYWDAQTPEFREAVLLRVIDSERAHSERQIARRDTARDALRNIEGAVEQWDWIPERGDIKGYVAEGLGV